MKELSSYNFCKTIADDYNIDMMWKHKTFEKEFPIVNGKRKIKSIYNSVIVDKEGKEHPYMLNHYQRNDEKLISFDHIYVMLEKGIDKICEEAGIKLKTEKCRICEGGGWTSSGFRYLYKDIYCEL